MKKWEYKIVRTLQEALFNQLGKDGWELVVGVYEPSKYYPEEISRFIFKRAKR